MVVDKMMNQIKPFLQYLDQLISHNHQGYAENLNNSFIIALVATG